MRLYIQDKYNLLKFNLPSKVDGSMLFNFKSGVNNIENSLNIDSRDGKWILKSNGSVNVLGANNTVVSEAVLSDYICVPISIVGLSNYLLVFCLPSVEEYQYCYAIGENNKVIKIGKSENSNIVYKYGMMSDEQAVIHYENNNWFISPASNNPNIYVYVNNQRILSSTHLFIGDVIFTNGLRVIWMGKNFIVPIDSRLYTVKGFTALSADNMTNNTKYGEVSEVDKNKVLYKENEYFSHVPRIRTSIENEEVEIEAPPAKAYQESDVPFLLTVGPSIMMMMTVVLNGLNVFNSINSGKGFMTILPQILMMVGMLIGSLLLPFLLRRYQTNSSKKKEELRVKKYREYLASKEKELQAIKTKQEQVLIQNNMVFSDCIGLLKNRSLMLWNRTVKDMDFLNVRLGIGDSPAHLSVKAPQERFTLEDDELYKEVCELGKKYNTLENTPIVAELKSNIVTAFIMQTKKRTDFINNMMIQLLSFQSPLELKIVVFTDQINGYKWDYLKYTAHNWSDDRQVRFFSTNQDEAKSLSQYLDNEFISRKERKAQKEKESQDVNKEKYEEYQLYDSYYLIITDSYKPIAKTKFVQDLLENQYNYGFSMVIFDERMKNIPNQCENFVVIDDAESAIVNQQINSETTVKFKADFASNLNMREIAKLVSNIPVQAKEGESQLPVSLSFLEMYNVGKIEQLNIRNRWKMSDPISSLSAPVGVHVNGELFNLDLHEKSDGPHGLIAGSTGSGKSEFIITYILSMALNYDPREVQFVLIDYKGGGLAGAFENRENGIAIPHLAGTITNLDTAEMNRTLVSIESELKRRQIAFNKVKETLGESTMDIYKYQRLYREGLIDEPISHLFIISDEFAELKAQQPDFMNQLVTTARIGRSLGVHLILATQKPSGVVNDQIWSNSRFKVCLKVQTKADSMEMLKRPEAASIKEAGRFYLQVGYDEYFDIGQSAWSGDKYVPTERIVKTVDDSIVFVNNLGNVIKRSVDPTVQNVKKDDLGDQLTNVVKYLSKISNDDGLKPMKLWLPKLDYNMFIDDIKEKYASEIDNSNNNELIALIGEYDAPQRQEQGPFTIDFVKDGNVLIYGTAGSGKDNIISSIVYYLSTNYSVDDVNFYIADFGSETLKMFNSIPHVGDAFVMDETQKLTNMIKMLNEELERRKKEYSEFGGSYSEYVKLSGKKDPFIIVALNNYENFLDNFPRMADVFSNLFRDGLKFGISFIVTTTLKTALRSRDTQNFMVKICTKMPEPTDYRDLLGTARGFIPADNYGRGIYAIDNGGAYEFQTADMCERDNRTQFIKDLGKELKAKYNKQKAKRIPVLPEVAYVEDSMHELKGLDCVPIGIEVNSLEVYVYDFLEQKINLIAAKSIKNHIYFVYALIKQMLSLKGVKVHVIDALDIYRGEYEGVDLYRDNLEKALALMCENVDKDDSLNEKHVYMILGINEFKKKIEGRYGANFERMISKVKSCKNNTFLYFDDSDSYKQIQIENWFRGNINNTFGIWLGEDIGIQVALGVMSLSIDDKKTVFPCIGFPVYQGRHMIIKYVVDGVDKEDEQ